MGLLVKIDGVVKLLVRIALWNVSHVALNMPTICQRRRLGNYRSYAREQDLQEHERLNTSEEFPSVIKSLQHHGTCIYASLDSC